MVKLELRNAHVCPHCDRPMDLMYAGVADGLKLICVLGCKAEYDVGTSIGKTTESPICGAKRVQTYGQ